MEDTSPLLSPPAKLALQGHDPTPARAEILPRPRSVRITRALLHLAGFWALAPVVFLLPPHIPWGLGAFAAGIYFAWSNWAGEYEVRAVEGSCPRCGSRLEIKAGTRISLPRTINCYQCHHEPRLEVSSLPQ